MQALTNDFTGKFNFVIDAQLDAIIDHLQPVSNFLLLEAEVIVINPTQHALLYQY
jgi:hypothetical protein